MIAIATWEVWEGSHFVPWIPATSMNRAFYWVFAIFWNDSYPLSTECSVRTRMDRGSPSVSLLPDVRYAPMVALFHRLWAIIDRIPGLKGTFLWQSLPCCIHKRMDQWRPGPKKILTPPRILTPLDSRVMANLKRKSLAPYEVYANS